MRIVYQVCFSKNNKYFTKRFDGETFQQASDFCDKVGGVIRMKRIPVRVDWRSIL